MTCGPTHARQRGFTFLEASTTAVLAFLALSTVNALFSASSRLASDNRANMAAAEYTRAGLQAVTSVLRCADLDSLSGFDADGNATEVSFRRVVGMTTGTPALGPVERLEWRAQLLAVNGVANPGAVFLVRPGGDLRLARNVPQGGFVVHQAGHRLDVRLTTFHALDARHVSRTTRVGTVTLRN